MTSKYKYGDVVIYADDGWAIVDHIRRLPGCRPDAVLVAWKSASERNWILSEDGRGALAVHTITPHPDSERIWAEFVAWRLVR